MCLNVSFYRTSAVRESLVPTGLLIALTIVGSVLAVVMCIVCFVKCCCYRYEGDAQLWCCHYCKYCSIRHLHGEYLAIVWRRLRPYSKSISVTLASNSQNTDSESRFGFYSDAGATQRVTLESPAAGPNHFRMRVLAPSHSRVTLAFTNACFLTDGSTSARRSLCCDSIMTCRS